LLSTTEKETLLSQKRDLQDDIRAIEEGAGIGTPASGINVSGIKRQIDRIDLAIAERTPPSYSGETRDKFAKECERLEEELALGMPTWDEMHRPTRHPGAIRKHMSWSKRNLPKIERYRHLQKILNPGEEKSVEELRKEK